MKKVSLVAAVAALAVGLGWAAPLVPGDQTDPTASAGRPTATSRGHEPDEPYRYPYISTYYVEPTVKAAAMCSFDAEDGWDLMQDVYLDGNKFGYNHVMCDMIGCGGHNFVCENNVGRIYFWGRCYSPVARKNSGINGVFHCTSRRRSGYGRFGNDNRWPYGIELGAGKNPHVDWEFGMRGVEFGPDKRPPAKIMVDKTGRLSGCTFTKTDVSYPMLSSCKMLGCNCALPAEGEWSGCKMKTCTFSGGTTLVLSDCKIAKSTFRYIAGGKLTFRRCTLEGVTFADVDADRIVFEDCTLNGTNPLKK